MGLRPLNCWDCGFESLPRQGCLSIVSAVCCQLEVPAELITHQEETYRVWCISECDREASAMRRTWPTRGCCSMGVNKTIHELWQKVWCLWINVVTRWEGYSTQRFEIFSMSYVPSSASSLNTGARINRTQQWEVIVSSKPRAHRFCTAFGCPNLGLRKRSSQPSRWLMKHPYLPFRMFIFQSNANGASSQNDLRSISTCPMPIDS